MSKYDDVPIQQTPAWAEVAAMLARPKCMELRYPDGRRETLWASLGAAPGGDGSRERPFNNMDDLYRETGRRMNHPNTPASPAPGRAG